MSKKYLRLQFLIDSVGAHGDSDECLVWPYSSFKLTTNFTWYGQVMFEGRKQGCHQVAYKMFKGPVPPSKRVLHTCDNPPCYNPRHLFAGTQADNMQDMCTKGRHVKATIPHGELNVLAVLTQKQADKIRSKYKAGVRGKGALALAKQFGVSKQTVQRIVRGQTY